MENQRGIVTGALHWCLWAPGQEHEIVPGHTAIRSVIPEIAAEQALAGAVIFRALQDGDLAFFGMSADDMPPEWAPPRWGPENDRDWGKAETQGWEKSAPADGAFWCRVAGFDCQEVKQRARQAFVLLGPETANNKEGKPCGARR